MVSASVKWRGHTLQLVKVYCPNAAGPRAAFINSAQSQQPSKGGRKGQFCLGTGTLCLPRVQTAGAGVLIRQQ